MSIDYEKLKILPLNFPKSYTYVYYLCFLGERLRKTGIELHIRYLLCLLAKAFFKVHCTVQPLATERIAQAAKRLWCQGSP